MSEIRDIYKIEYFRNKFYYAGTLRNERRFNLHDDIFFVVRENEIAKGRIVGVELPLHDNPDYIYKVQLPSEYVESEWHKLDVQKQSHVLERVSLKCDKIFLSLEDAKASAMQKLEQMYSLQKGEIENYFNQFKTRNEKSKTTQEIIRVLG